MLLWLKNLNQAGGQLPEQPVRGPAFGVESAIHLNAAIASRMDLLAAAEAQMLNQGVGVGSVIEALSAAQSSVERVLARQSRIDLNSGTKSSISDDPLGVESELE